MGSMATMHSGAHPHAVVGLLRPRGPQGWVGFRSISGGCMFLDSGVSPSRGRGDRTRCGPCVGLTCWDVQWRIGQETPLFTRLGNGPHEEDREEVRQSHDGCAQPRH